MKKLSLAAAAVIAIGVALPIAQTATAPILTTSPTGKTINKYYKQNVYDPAKDKIGTIDDVVISDGGQIQGFIVGVGGFLGVGEKRCRGGLHCGACRDEGQRLVPDDRYDQGRVEGRAGDDLR